MTKYLFKRLLHGLLSAIAVVIIVMTLVYTLMNRIKIFKGDTDFTKRQYNLKEIYMYEKWEEYGYLDYINFKDYVAELVKKNEITLEEQKQIIAVGDTTSKDSSITKKYVKMFEEKYTSKRYKFVRLDAIKKPYQSTEIFVYKNIPVISRFFKYFGQMFFVDNIHYVERHVTDNQGNKVILEDKGLKFTLFDPVYNTKESGYKLKIDNNYLLINKDNIEFTTDSSSATLFTWSPNYQTFCIIKEDTNEYGLIIKDNKIIYDNLSQFNNDDKNQSVFHFETYNQRYSEEEPFDFSPYLVLETYINFKVYLEVQDNYLPYVSAAANNEEKKGFIKLDNNKLEYITNEQDASRFALEFEDGGINTKKVFSPAIMGIGTKYKYLLYFDNKFPFIHQNLISINLGTSYSINTGIEITDTLFNKQDPIIKSRTTFPTGYVEVSPINLHSAKYIYQSRTKLSTNEVLFEDDYASCLNYKTNKSKTGFSFVIGVISTIAAYILGVPLGIILARKKDGFIDRLGTIYVIFIIAVPSLAYILMFKTIGVRLFGLPEKLELTNLKLSMYILPIISLTLPSVAGLMKWIRRYMIDQMNSDYVKFARSGGLSEKEIFNKHILKNAIIPIVQGIPGSLIGAIVGAIITERIYAVPGAGALLTEAIGKYDNSVIVGLTLFYAVLSIIGLVAGDILMAMVDPRISFTDNAR